MRITGIDHVGILVPDLEAALGFFTETLGLSAGPIETYDEQSLRRACIRVGDAEIELIEAGDPQATMMRHLPDRRLGPYHIALRVEDVDEAVGKLRAAGVPLIGELREAGGMRIQYLQPDAARGSLIELVTRKR